MVKLFKNKKMLIVMVSVSFFVIGIIWLVYENRKQEDVQNILQDMGMESFESDGNLENDVQGWNEGEVKDGVEGEDIVKSDDEIFVHIIGEVNRSGVLKLTKGQRIVDAVELAGGVTESADLSKVNLAYVLSDGQQINIPSIYDETGNFQYVTEGSGDGVISGNGDGVKSSNNEVKVNINSASQSELETLDGIGPSLANRIIEYRKKNGEFKSVEEIKNVAGIGESKYERLKDSIVVK